MSTFVTDADVKASVVQAALSKGVADVSATKWDKAVSDANQAAYDLIRDHWTDLGYSPAQIAAWQSGRTYQLFIARYQALMDGAGDNDKGLSEWRKELDYWRGKLDALTTIISGDATVVPTANESGVVGHGSLSTSNDLFRMDPDDARIGTPTEW